MTKTHRNRKKWKFETFPFFQKKINIFSNFENPLKKQLQELFFLKSWFNFKTSQNRFKTFSEVAEGIVRKVWLHTLWFWGFKCDDFTLCEIVAFKSQERSFLTSKARDLLIWKLKIVAFKDEMCNHHSEVWNTWTTPKSYHPFNMVTLFTLLVLKCDDLLHSQSQEWQYLSSEYLIFVKFWNIKFLWMQQIVAFKYQ